MATNEPQLVRRAGKHVKYAVSSAVSKILEDVNSYEDGYNPDDITTWRWVACDVFGNGAHSTAFNLQHGCAWIRDQTGEIDGTWAVDVWTLPGDDVIAVPFFYTDDEHGVTLTSVAGKVYDITMNGPVYSEMFN